MTHKIFIYGSCVTRDMVRVTNRFDISYYAARQTITSGFTPPYEHNLSLEKAGGDFAQRSLAGDLASDITARLHEYGPESDAIVIDISTEHWGVVPIGGGSYLTRSTELASSKVLHELDRGEPVLFGTDEHFRLYQQGAAELYRQLQELDLIDKTIVLNTPFATHTTTGDLVPPSKEQTPEYWMERHGRYYDELEQLGFNIVAQPPEELVVSTPDHIWGPAVYHYVDELYHWWGDQIAAFISLSNPELVEEYWEEQPS